MNMYCPLSCFQMHHETTTGATKGITENWEWSRDKTEGERASDLETGQDITGRSWPRTVTICPEGGKKNYHKVAV